MIFALTTHWNAWRHSDGEALLTEILELGLNHVELGYDLRLDLVPGVRKLVEEGTVKVDSVHNFCPVPVGAPKGHPELFTLADPDLRIREGAVKHTTETIRFAESVGARVVVCHAGNVKMPRLSRDLLALQETGRRFDAIYDKTLFKLQIKREKKSKKQFQYMMQGIESLLPVLEETGIVLALENLPTWEAFPTEIEMQELLAQYGGRNLRYWHDIGHGQIRENLGLINAERWLDRLQDHLAGMHIHDVAPPGHDHLMPPTGQVDFSRFRRFAELDVLRVLEPSPQAPTQDVILALQTLKETWECDYNDPVKSEDSLNEEVSE
ncbi:MAG: sugar phosphate isomerase/epimerase [Verrucomicrobia bacterium]|nr:sugar phosphate isomerase/epimerase [Verrucomicrobiota bacterium]